MDDYLEVRISWDDPLFFQALENPEGLLPHLSEAMQTILTEYQKVAEVYAPESEANRPGRVDAQGKPMGYYERGRGSWYPLVTKLTLNEDLPKVRPHLKAPSTLKTPALLAEGFSNVVGYRLRPTSQQMHDRWLWEVIQDPTEVIGNLSNTATYSSYVQGLRRTKLHESRGWIEVLESWDDSRVQSVVDEATLKALNEYYRG